MLDTLSSDDFRPCIDQPFQTRLGDTPVQLSLAEIEVMDERYSRSGTRRPFSLMLLGPVEPLMPQGTYRLDNETLGPLDVFMVPLGPDGGGQRYQIIFS